MKTSSKSSILSPGRVPDPTISLSRRLRTNGSLKNGQAASPMFPTGNKKKFENPEPSSPKVTCIGQVRVKTKKHGKKMRNNLSRRPSSDMSFRRNEHNQMQRQFSVNSQYHNQECSSSHRNQRWVHLPLSVCESLRGFGSEFSCLFPCKSSCFSKDDERVGRRRSSSCGDVFANWLVALDDDSGECEKRRDVDLVVEEEGNVVRRRHVFDEIEIQDCYEERGRVSICVPPKNALLLMRCRSDPVKMEALATKFWESTHIEDDREVGTREDANNDRYIEEEEEAMVNLENVEVKEEVEEENVEVFEERRASVSSKLDQVLEEEKQVDMKLEVEVEVKEKEEFVNEEMHVNVELKNCEQEEPFEDSQSNEEAQEQELLEDLQSSEEAHICDQEVKTAGDLQSNEEAHVIEQDDTEWMKKIVEDEEENESSFVTALEVVVNQESEQVVEGEESSVSCSFNSFALNSDDEISKPNQNDQQEEEDSGELNDAVENVCDDMYTHTEALLENVQIQEGELQVEEKEESRVDIVEEEEQSNDVVLETESDKEINKEERQTLPMLPDCLLLMMCEPKLSMEVSKETWVCSTDFIRWRPLKKKTHAPPVQHKNFGAGDEGPVTEKRTSVVEGRFNNPLPPPSTARLSCCLPTAKGGVPMGKMIEQKLVDAVAYEPFVLTRCKSEPTRTAAKLTQEATNCFWKNRAMAPQTYRVGATGVGC